MNNSVPNNNENNNDLNAVSLGSIDNLNGNSIPPVSPVNNARDSLNDVNLNGNEELNNNSTLQAQDTNTNVFSQTENVQPVSPVPPIEPVNSVNTTTNSIPDVNAIPPVQPVSYDIPETINNFNTTSVFNEIGTVPPIPDGPIQTPVINSNEPKKSKKVNKLIFVIIIVLLIAAIGVGVYIFLNVSNRPASVNVTLKDVEIEVGGNVSTDINDYATFKGVNSASCSLDTSNITDTNAVDATYTFNITCGAKTYSGNVKIVDKTAPLVVLKEVTAQVNGEIKPEDFIDSCTDVSECTYEFSDTSKVNGYLGAAGNYHIDIIVKDKVGNETKVTGTLIVTEEEVPDLYLTCTANNEKIKMGLTSSVITGSIYRSYSFTLSESEYKDFKTKNDGKNEVTYQNVTGVPSFDDNSFTLTITQKLSKDNLEQEKGSTLPESYGELRQYFTSLGYTCALEQP